MESGVKMVSEVKYQTKTSQEQTFFAYWVGESFPMVDVR